MTKYDRITLEDVFLCDPVTKRGKSALNRICSIDGTKKMTLSDFYNHIYVEPFFVKSSRRKHKRKLPKIQNNLYEDFYFSEIGLSRKNLNDKKERYEKNFLSSVSDCLMFIRASAGAGKSIYLNYLKLKRRNIYTPNKVDLDENTGYIEDLFELSFDLESSTSIIQHGYVSFPSKNYNIGSCNASNVDSPWHFFNMLIDALFDISLSIIQKKDPQKVELIEKNFKKMYGINYEDELENLYKIIKCQSISSDNEREVVSTLFDTIIKVCFIDPNSVSMCITKALQTLTRMLAINSNWDDTKQVLVTFDNIEHFINNEKRIFDEDIKEITTAVVNFVDMEFKYYDKLKLNFANFFKIVLVVRDTTSKMLANDVHTKFNKDDCSIDVTGWFSLEEIYDNKLVYFSLSEESSVSLKFFKLIVDDSLPTSKNNLMEQISAMYNHNNRRATRMLTRIVGIFEQNDIFFEGNKKVLKYEQYCGLWKSPRRMHIKYLCRNSVMRLIYNEISATGYFSSICNNIDKCTSEKNTFAIRVLTWLSNKESHKSENYHSYFEIVKAILCSPEVQESDVSDLKIEELSQVLVALDEHRFEEVNSSIKPKTGVEPNCWCQLLIIKHNSDIEKSWLESIDLANEMKNQYKSESYNSEHYGIRLTEAGNFFAKTLIDFEFFACQYDKSNMPLIFITDPNQIKSTIESVYRSAKKFIDNILLFEYYYFNRQFLAGYDKLYNWKHISKNNNQEFQSLPYRIITQHTFYLKAYALYIGENKLHNNINLFDESTRKEIVNFTEKYIGEYTKLQEQLEKNCYKIGEKTISGYFLTKKL